MLKGALHTHTTCSDGELTVFEVLRIYRDLGFDFVALTDHDFLLRPDSYSAVPDTFEGMLVFKGVERTVFARGYVHVSEIAGDREVLRVFNHPAACGFPVEQVIELIDEVDQTTPIDAVEVTTNGFYTPEYDTDAIRFPKVATDDAHTRGGCGCAWIEVDCERDKDAIIQAIRQGEAAIAYSGMARRLDWESNAGGAHRG